MNPIMTRFSFSLKLLLIDTAADHPDGTPSWES
jgi:hypothetical protein